MLENLSVKKNADQKVKSKKRCDHSRKESKTPWTAAGRLTELAAYPVIIDEAEDHGHRAQGDEDEAEPPGALRLQDVVRKTLPHIEKKFVDGEAKTQHR